MEDNNYRHEEFDNCLLCNHPVLKHILTGLLTLLGAFLAFYVVSDWHFKRMMDPGYQMRRFDRAMMRQEHRMDKLARKEMERQYRMDEKISNFIHIDKTDDAYKIIIDLTPFDNNEKNVEVTTNGNILTINAAGVKDTRNKRAVIRYNQSFTFGDDVELKKMTKVREGNHYIITVPIE